MGQDLITFDGLSDATIPRLRDRLAAKLHDEIEERRVAFRISRPRIPNVQADVVEIIYPFKGQPEDVLEYIRENVAKVVQDAHNGLDNDVAAEGSPNIGRGEVENHSPIIYTTITWNVRFSIALYELHKLAYI
ncbi:unnamed protein product [Cochlearia groenlandica]